jgi:murein DD-endopeptidase MepM/ murein hydrolase activator NlpD
MPIRRHPVRYTLWLARTGAAPRTLSLPAWLPVVVVLGLLAWSGLNVWLWNRTAEMRSLQVQLITLSDQARKLNNQLGSEQTRNNQLTSSTQKILRQLKTLETEINTLRVRAGMPKIELTPARDDRGAKGGTPQPVTTEAVLAYTSTEIKRLGGTLGEVSPALNQTLEREEAMPLGYPVPTHIRTTSNFGYRRSPFGWSFEFHNGLDFSAPFGTPIQATAAGTVVEAGWKGPFGLAVVIDHGYGHKTLYGHMSTLQASVGAQVQRGSVIGLVGSTGRSTGPHLHYTVYQGGAAVNPREFID